MARFNRARTVILVWPGEDQPQPTWDGMPVLLPPRTGVADPSIKGSPYRFASARDASGKFIPGTVLLEDEFYRDVDTGSTLKAFDAEGFVEGIEKVNPLLFLRGLDTVERVEDIPAAMAAGLPKWLAARIAQWEETVRREAERRAKYDVKGQPAPPLTDGGETELARAILGLRENQNKRKSAVTTDDLLEAIGGDVASKAPTVAPVASVEVETNEDLALASVGLYRAAKDAGITLAPAEVDGLLNQDRSVMTAVEMRLDAAGVGA